MLAASPALRSTPAARHPSAANRVMIARPIPEPQPVTTTLLGVMPFTSHNSAFVIMLQVTCAYDYRSAWTVVRKVNRLTFLLAASQPVK
jgi:hypothetical protein